MQPYPEQQPQQQPAYQQQQPAYQQQQPAYQQQQPAYQPQQQSYQPQQAAYSTSAMMMPMGGNKTVWIAPWIGVGLIFLMMFMPFVDAGPGFELSGFELMEEVAEIMEDYEGDGSDGGGDDDDLPAEYTFFGIATLMLAFSPFVFLFSAILSAILMGLKKHPVVIGALHMTYFGIFMICSVIGTIDFGSESITVHGDLAGVGFFLAGLSGIALCIKA